MNSPCGCSTAAQCYASCCCHTAVERRAWAKARGLDPIVDALLRLRSEPIAPQPPLSDGTDHGSEADGHAGSPCCPSRRDEKDSTQRGNTATSVATSATALQGPDICSAYRQFATPARCAQHVEQACDSSQASDTVQESLDAPLNDLRAEPALPAGENEPDDDQTTGVTLRAMLACGGVVAEWLNVGSGPPPSSVAEVMCMSPVPEAIATLDESLNSLRPPPDAPPPRTA